MVMFSMRCSSLLFVCAGYAIAYAARWRATGKRCKETDLEKRIEFFSVGIVV